MGNTQAAAAIATRAGWTGSDFFNIAVLLSLIIYPLLYAYIRRSSGKTIDDYRIVQALLTGPNIPVAICLVLGVAFPSVQALVADKAVFLAICGGIVLFTVLQTFWAD